MSSFTSQLKAGSSLLQLYAFAFWTFLIGVVTERYEVVMISKSDDALAIFLWNWKKVFENACHPLA